MGNVPCGNTFTKQIQNPSETPWLNWLLNSTKKFEGRLYRNDWTRMAVGDRLWLQHGSKKHLFRITSIHRFGDFAKAFDELGHELVPIDGITRETVVELYSQYYSTDDINTYGVVAIGVEPCDIMEFLDDKSLNDFVQAQVARGYQCTGGGSFSIPLPKN